MKKLLLASLCFLVLFVTQTYAQNRTITGTVTAKEDGLPIPGASVKVKGTNIGTQTNANGKYTLSGIASGSTLVFSFIGTLPQEVTVGSSSTINVTLANNAKQLTEVVITGVNNTKQNSRSASYAAQVVNSDQLNTVRQPNLNNALAGKVAGVQVLSQSAATLGRNTQVRLRGAVGFGTGSGALYVVDGTILPNADDLNTDDVDNVSVLEGPAASAQFGPSGSNGAIVITTKRGKRNSGLGVDLNIGATFDKAYILPNYQNTYAGGASADLMQYHWKAGDPVEWKALDGKYYPDYTDDSSWGPKMVGQEYIPWYAWYPGTQYSFKTAKLVPQPDNAKEFFNTGVTWNNSIAVSKGTDDYTYRVSYGNQNVLGLLPTTSLNKNTFNLNTTYNLNKHFTVGANINYISQKVIGDIGSSDVYSNQSSGSFNQWFHRDIDMNIMKQLQGLRAPDGVYATWNHNNPTGYDPSDPRSFYAANYWYNFYTYQNLTNTVNQRDRLYGNIDLTYKLNDDFNIKATYRKNETVTYFNQQFSTDLNYSGTQTTGNEPRNKGYYATSSSYSNRENYNLFANYNKTIKDFTVDANAGMDIYNWIYRDNSANTNNGLSIDNLYTIGNSVDQPTVGNTRIQEQYRALLAKASVGYKRFIYLDGTVRKDWFSTVPNAVLSKSFGGSLVFSDLLPSTKSWLSYGKLRASYGEVPAALGTSNETYGAYRYPGMAYGVSQYKWGSNILMGTPDQFVDPSIHGNVSRQTEFGADFRFVNDRIGLSATYYHAKDSDYPLALNVNAASGYSSILTNIGLFERRGLELVLNATPFKSPNFSWDVNTTWSRQLEDKVVQISQKYGVSRVNVQGVWGTTMPYLIQQEGMTWGQLYGNGIKRNAQGVPIIGSNGMYENNPNVYFGSVLPRFNGGLQNSFTIAKSFSIAVNFDYQVGGKFASLSDMWGSYSGLTTRTAALNDKGNPVRDPVADGGGVHVTGVDDNGKPVSNYIDAKDYFQGLYNNKTFDSYIYDLTYVKLREASLTYRIPVQRLGVSKYIKGASFAVIGRDLWLIYAKTKDFDPSQISAASGETGQLPGTRGLGFNLKVQF